MDFLKRLFQRQNFAQDGPLRLDLPSPPHKPPPQPKPQPAGDPVPGNFFYFPYELDLEIAGVVQIGRPKKAVRNEATGEVRWGENLRDISPLPDPNRPRLRWTDDPARGVNQRTIENPEDVLGAEGMFSDKPARFESILDLGRHIVVYALFCPDHNFRIAYGWPRKVFQPGYVHPAPTPANH